MNKEISVPKKLEFDSIPLVNNPNNPGILMGKMVSSDKTKSCVLSLDKAACEISLQFEHIRNSKEGNVKEKWTAFFDISGNYLRQSVENTGFNHFTTPDREELTRKMKEFLSQVPNSVSRSNQTNIRKTDQ